MSHTNIMLGTNWEPDEWPDHVDVSHEGAGDGVRYVPEVRRCGTCTVESSCYNEGVDSWVFELSCGDLFMWWCSCPPDFCPYCGCEVIGSGN